MTPFVSSYDFASGLAGFWSALSTLAPARWELRTSVVPCQRKGRVFDAAIKKQSRRIKEARRARFARFPGEGHWHGCACLFHYGVDMVNLK